MRERKLYNIILCYHGFVEVKEEALVFRSYIDDFKHQINHLRELGYEFVTAEDFTLWYKGLKQYDKPIASIHFDDALNSMELVCDWLVEEGVPFSVPIITRVLRKIEPEDGFISWEKLANYYVTGLCEITSHTHNLHLLNLAEDAEGNVVSRPVLGGPYWWDNGDHVYMETGDNRHYWERSIVDEYTWGFPLFGTDPDTGVPVESSMKIKVKEDVEVSVIRVWAALHLPASTGYSTEIEIRINGVLVADTVFYPTQYETRSQWLEREFASIPLDTTYQMFAGQTYDIEFKTKNVGHASFRIYTLPDFTGNFELKSNVTEQDYPPGEIWPARPTIILSDGTGQTVSDETYVQYISEDFERFQNAVDNYLGARWIQNTTGYNPNEYVLRVIVLGGTYEDGTMADTWFRYSSQRTFTAESLQFQYAGRVGKRYAMIVDVMVGERVGICQYSNEQILTRFAPTWADFKWVNLDVKPFTFEAGKDYYIRFKTMNETKEDTPGLVRIIMNQPFPPEPIWHCEEVCDDSGCWDACDWIVPTDEEYEHEESYCIKNPEHSDLWPNGVYFDENNDWFWRYDEPYTGPGIPFIRFMERESASNTPKINIMCYPFGAYYDIGQGTSYITEPTDTNPLLNQIMKDFQYISAFTIWPARVDKQSKHREPDVRFTEYTIPRVLVYGDLENNIVINNFDAYTGVFWEEVKHRGIGWQTSVEYDPLGNATILNTVHDCIAFDAHYFRPGVVIEPGDINMADKTIVQGQGRKAFLIFSNYSFEVGGPDGEIASEVLDDPEPYINKIIQTLEQQNWDGAYINLEWVPPVYKYKANEFFKELSHRIRAIGKEIQASLPAITGTNYDYIPWTGWCDYATLVRYLNAVKIMTYTESGEFSDAQPHAPTEFVQSVVNYIKKTVPSKFWIRIMLGANTYGHIWYSKFTAYVSFHRAVAEAIKLGVPIKIIEGEGYWQKDNIECYFGIPNTVARIASFCEENGFWGVSTWKADDGDIYHHYPIAAQPRSGKVNWRAD